MSDRKSTLKPEDIVRQTTEIGRLARLLQRDRTDEISEATFKSIEGSVKSLISMMRQIAFNSETVVQNITRGFVLAQGDFFYLPDLFEILREYGLPNDFAPNLIVVALSSSPRDEFGFVLRQTDGKDLKIIARKEGDKNAETVIETLIAICNERRARKEALMSS